MGPSRSAAIKSAICFFAGPFEELDPKGQ
jgi:hypothetical protein